MSILKWLKKKKTILTGEVYTEILGMNNHIDLVSNACSECYMIKKDRDYKEKQDYIQKRSATGHESIFEHSNIIMLQQLSGYHTNDLIELLTTARYLNTKVVNKNGDMYLLIGGSIRGYKELFRKIKNINNSCLASIRESLYELESCYFTDFIEDSVMDERKFLNMREYHRESVYESDLLDIENIDSITVLQSKLVRSGLYGEGLFTYNDLLDMVSVTIHVKEISRIISQQLTRHRVGITQKSQRYVNYSNTKFLSPNKFKDIYDEDHQYEIKVTNEHGIERIEHYTLEELGQALIAIYPQLVEQGLAKEDARAYLPNNVETSLYMTFTYRQLLHFLHLRTEKAAQAETRAFADTVRNVFDKDKAHKEESYEELVQYLQPVYKQSELELEVTYDEIDEVIK